MLIQFCVENFLSIREKAVLSLLASNDKDHPSHCILSENFLCLKFAVLYGTNGSGKSNVLTAFEFTVNYVMSSHAKQLNCPTNRVPFKFSKKLAVTPSSFEVIFIQDGIRYAYGFSATDKEITDEYLYHYANGKRVVIFERTNTDRYQFTADVELQNKLKDRNLGNRLYLSTAANWNYEKVKPAFQ